MSGGSTDPQWGFVSSRVIGAPPRWGREAGASERSDWWVAPAAPAGLARAAVGRRGQGGVAPGRGAGAGSGRAGEGLKAREIAGRRLRALGDVVLLSRHWESVSHRTGRVGRDRGDIGSELSAQAGSS